jgi:hypothetical protein|tara:strand:- start:140 stop:340 length:201 start_codon:yes stop_codon:yes gene_type:complete
MQNFLEKYILGQMLRSKKFWYTIVGVLTQLLNEKLGLDPVQTEAILYSIIALVLGQGIADVAKEKK